MMQIQDSNPLELAVGQKRPRNIISLTPLIDVVFILLIFFMLASSFMDWRAIPLDTSKPPATVSTATPKETWTLRIDATSTSLNGEVLELDELLQRLAQQQAIDTQLTLRIQPVGDTPLQPVVTVLDKLNAGGFTRLNFVRDVEWVAKPR
ncbi:MAG: biopolymer transporter ExbD [Pseudomonadota bacterium]